jgi:hypothetical protein
MQRHPRSGYVDVGFYPWMMPANCRLPLLNLWSNTEGHKTDDFSSRLEPLYDVLNI